MGQCQLVQYPHRPSQISKNVSNLVTFLVFTLSSVNPGLALIIVTLDADPFHRLNKYGIKGNAVLSISTSLSFVMIRILLTTWVIAEATRILSFKLTAFVGTLHLVTSRLNFIRGNLYFYREFLVIFLRLRDVIYIPAFFSLYYFNFLIVITVVLTRNYLLDPNVIKGKFETDLIPVPILASLLLICLIPLALFQLFYYYFLNSVKLMTIGFNYISFDAGKNVTESGTNFQNNCRGIGYLRLKYIDRNGQYFTSTNEIFISSQKLACTIINVLLTVN